MTKPLAQGSIRRRLLLSLLASAAVLAFVVYFVVLSVARQAAQESQDNVLAASALAILDSARFSGGQINVDLPYSALSMLDSVSHERVFYSIRLEDAFLSGYPDLPVTEGAPTGMPAYASTKFLDEDVRIATVRRRVSAGDGQSHLIVSVAQTLSGQKETVARISRTSMSIGAAVFLVSVLLAAMISRSAIKPMDRLTESVSRRGPQDLRPVAAPVPSEMVPLVASLNSFMRRLRRSLLRSEELIAEAAHRVRTPLAIVRTKAEIVKRKSKDAKTRAAIDEMIHAIDDSSRTAGQLLDHAMVTFRLDHLLREEINLLQLLKETVERLRPLSELKDVSLEVKGSEEAILFGDPILLQNAIQNLLDNAIKYVPAGSAILAQLTSVSTGIRITITDNGPGFPEPELGHLTDRFRRGENAQNIVGSGLGLTIVKEVVEAHGGLFRIENTKGGGACVSLFFQFS